MQYITAIKYYQRILQRHPADEAILKEYFPIEFMYCDIITFLGRFIAVRLPFPLIRPTVIPITPTSDKTTLLTCEEADA